MTTPQSNTISKATRKKRKSSGKDEGTKKHGDKRKSDGSPEKKKRKRSVKLSEKDLLFQEPSSKETEQPQQLKPVSDRLPVFHGATAASLASAPTVQNMATDQRHEYLSEVTKHCEVLLSLMHDVLMIGKQRAADELPSLDDQLTSDLLRLRKMPLARRYVEMTMWQQVSRFSDECLANASAIARMYDARRNAGRSGVSQTQLTLTTAGETETKIQSFKDRYMKTVLHNYEKDLEKIRVAEEMDIEQVVYLRNCLEAGSEVFADVGVKTDDAQKRESKQ